jgi:hypothetical protein
MPKNSEGISAPYEFALTANGKVTGLSVSRKRRSFERVLWEDGPKAICFLFRDNGSIISKQHCRTMAKLH